MSEAQLGDERRFPRHLHLLRSDTEYEANAEWEGASAQPRSGRSVGGALTQSMRMKASTMNAVSLGCKGPGCIGARARPSLPLLSVRRTPLLAAAGRINAFKSIVRSETKELRQRQHAERLIAKNISALTDRG